MRKVHASSLSVTLLAVAIGGCGSSSSGSTGLGDSGMGGSSGVGGSVGEGDVSSSGSGGVAGMLGTGGGAATGGTENGSDGSAGLAVVDGGIDASVASGGSTGKGGAAGAGTDGAAADSSIPRGSGGQRGTPDAALDTGPAPGTGGVRASGGSGFDAGSTGAAATGGVRSTGGVVASGGSAGAVPSGGTTGTAGSVGTPNVTVDLATQYQTIEGFGFFGAQDNWWGNAGDMWSDDWGNLVINDLGITMWRSEYYSEEPKQDANWAKQKPVVQGFKRIADANRVPLKFLLTVWSPPSSMKCTTASVQAGQAPCTPNPDGLKNGGTLDPSEYAAFADWLAQGIKNYADVGVDLYGISPQNEPKFVETYNSCEYDVDPSKLNSYSRMIEAVAPLVKKAYPNVKIFGTENMLGLEGQQWFYFGSLDSAGWSKFDALAYHGYQDGVAPTAGSQLATYWVYVRDNWAIPHNKPSWMTETSGYTDVWGDAKGAKALGFAIYAALNYGQASAWVWWQGSELGGPPNEYGLMGGIENLSKRYFVSKSFYRFIRPGAQMVKVSTSDPDLFVVAFVHPTMNATTVVAINNASKDKPLVLGGSSIPSTYSAFRTSAAEDCVSVGSVTNGGITLKADSITTLVSGQYIE
jgi:glucuronoarabinoxylan endo-1,4-beta-xylanase